jgi:hypothetical protein
MRLWHAATIAVGLAILYATVFVPSLSPVPLLLYAFLFCIVFASVDGIIFAIAKSHHRRPDWQTITIVNVILWLLAWVI